MPPLPFHEGRIDYNDLSPIREGLRKVFLDAVTAWRRQNASQNRFEMPEVWDSNRASLPLVFRHAYDMAQPVRSQVSSAMCNAVDEVIADLQRNGLLRARNHSTGLIDYYMTDAGLRWVEGQHEARVSDRAPRSAGPQAGGSRTAATGARYSVFISHSEADVAIAEALVTFLKESTSLRTKTDISCTSVPGHTLNPGDDINQAVRHRIRSSQLVVGLLTGTSLQSQWVLFELGAGWILEGSGSRVVALLHPALSFGSLPDPIRGKVAIKLDDSEGIGRFLELVVRSTGAEQSANDLVMRATKRLVDFAGTLAESELAHRDPGSTAEARQAASLRSRLSEMVAQIDALLAKLQDTGYERTLSDGVDEAMRGMADYLTSKGLLELAAVLDPGLDVNRFTAPVQMARLNRARYALLDAVEA